MSNLAKWKKFTKEELQEMANNSISNAQWIQKMGYANCGGNITRVPKEILQEYPDINISHFIGQGWKKDTDSYDLLSSDYQGKRETIKRALINRRGQKCERCNLAQWQGMDIPLEVHHIDGDNRNNSADNLLLLCPNCHALTNNYRGRNRVKDNISDEDFVEALKNSSSIRQALILLGLSPKGGNYERAYKLISQYNIEHLK